MYFDGFREWVRTYVLSKTIAIAALASLLGFLIGSGLDIVKEQNNEAKPDETLGSLTVDSGEHYVCPMHAQVISDKPGSCSICSMKLVKDIHETSYSPDPPTTADNEIFPTVTIKPTVAHNLGIRTAVAKRKVMQRKIETIGKITRLDPTARRIITPPIAGELVHVSEKYEGDHVKEGELLFSVSSAELLEAEDAYQKAIQSDDRAAATHMIPKLRQLGLNPEQIALLQTGQARNLPAEVYAPEDGFVFSRRGKIGDTVTTSFTVFNLGGDYQVVEVTAEIFERQWGWVEDGQEATMTVRGLPGKIFRGKVVRVEPPVGYTTRSLEVRLKFKTDNPGISQSMFAHVNILAKPRHNLLMVPRDAVIRTGSGDRVVVVQDNGRFQPVAVVAGEESSGDVEIVSGLKEGDKVVVSGQFLIDSESNLSAGLRRMTTVDGNNNYKEHHGNPTQQYTKTQEDYSNPTLQKSDSLKKPDGGNNNNPHHAVYRSKLSLFRQ